jgi:hypothetical protein
VTARTRGSAGQRHGTRPASRDDIRVVRAERDAALGRTALLEDRLAAATAAVRDVLRTSTAGMGKFEMLMLLVRLEARLVRILDLPPDELSGDVPAGTVASWIHGQDGYAQDAPDPLRTPARTRKQPRIGRAGHADQPGVHLPAGVLPWPAHPPGPGTHCRDTALSGSGLM